MLTRLIECIYLLVALFSVRTGVVGQVALPIELIGTWKVTGKSAYEQWDVLNPESMRGLVYVKQGTELDVKEYLRLEKDGEAIYYGAIVHGQNEGKEVLFLMTRKDSVIVFENPDHDFPKRIAYKIMGSDQLSVQVSDGSAEGFSYILERAGLVLPPESDTPSTNYDASLADLLGADEL